MTLYSVPVVAMASISCLVGIFFLYIYLRYPEDQTNGSFALVCFAIAAYDIGCIGLYNSSNLSTSVEWQRLQYMAIALITVSLSFFYHKLTGKLSARTLVIITGINIVFIIAGYTIRNQLTLSPEYSAEKLIALGGLLSIHILEARPGSILNIQVASSLVVYTICLFGLINFQQSSGRRKTAVVIAIIVFYFAAVNDALVAMGIASTPYLIEYAFAAIIVSMALMLVRAFLDLHDKIEDMNLSLEETVRKRIREHRRVEEALSDSKEKYRASEEGFKSIVNSSPMGIHLYELKNDDRLVFTGANLAADRLLGVDHGQFIGQTIEEAFPPLIETKIPERYRNAAQNGTVWHNEQLIFNDEKIKGAFEVVAFQTDQKKMAVFFNEITARRKVAEALRDSEEKFRTLVEQSPLGISLVRKDGRYKYINPRFREMFGYTLEDCPNGKEWFKLAYPDEDYRQEVLAAWIEEQQRAKVGQVRPRVFMVTCKDGSRKEIHFRPVTMENQEQFVIYEDVTNRSRIERQLKQTQKFEAIGTLAGGIAHDFNNLLMGIQGRASLISARLEPFHPHLEHTRAIENYIRSATDLTRQLLGLARGGKYEVRPTDINLLVRNSASMFGRTKKEIQIHTNFQDPPPVVLVDGSQIEQVLLNLYINAWQAMPGGGELYLETRLVDLDEAYCRPYNATPGQYAKVSVADTGIGMSEDTMQRIFDPFFTTKEKGRGTGLGLASAYGIIKNHDGIIIVRSKIGHGTRFNIYLPLSEENAYREAPVKSKLVRGSETILLIDDEEMILEVGQAMLKELGYRIDIAVGGKQAIDVVKQKGSQIDLVILDLIMPGMNGGKVFDRIREIRPQMPVLLSSGYAIDGQADEIMKKGCNGFIQKPFNISKLSRKVREILDASKDFVKA